MLERSARELSRVDELFRACMWPRSSTASLERQPERARLGGEERRGERALRRPGGIHGLLRGSGRPATLSKCSNRYWASAVPAVVDEAALMDRFAGDAIMSRSTR